MGIVQKNCLKLLDKCMAKKMSVDTIVQVANISYLPEQKAQIIISELMKIVEKSTEVQLRQKLTDLL